MKIVLDTNFIVTCAKEKIDFEHITNEIISENVEWLVPQQVLNELGNLKDNKSNKKSDRDAATLSFAILANVKPQVIELEKNPNVDLAIINYINNKNILLATLDKGLKERLPNNKFLTLKGKNYLQII